MYAPSPVSPAHIETCESVYMIPVTWEIPPDLLFQLQQHPIK